MAPIPLIELPPRGDLVARLPRAALLIWTTARSGVGPTKEQIKNRPEYDEAAFRGNDYRRSLDRYYGPLV